ncbi:hypothetical protein CLF_104788, partial [Clonorchis sinensis]
MLFDAGTCTSKAFLQSNNIDLGWFRNFQNFTDALKSTKPGCRLSSILADLFRRIRVPICCYDTKKVSSGLWELLGYQSQPKCLPHYCCVASEEKYTVTSDCIKETSVQEDVDSTKYPLFGTPLQDPATNGSPQWQHSTRSIDNASDKLLNIIRAYFSGTQVRTRYTGERLWSLLQTPIFGKVTDFHRCGFSRSSGVPISRNNSIVDFDHVGNIVTLSTTTTDVLVQQRQKSLRATSHRCTGVFGNQPSNEALCAPRPSYRYYHTPVTPGFSEFEVFGHRCLGQVMKETEYFVLQKRKEKTSSGLLGLLTGTVESILDVSVPVYRIVMKGAEKSFYLVANSNSEREINKHWKYIMTKLCPQLPDLPKEEVFAFLFHKFDSHAARYVEMYENNQCKLAATNQVAIAVTIIIRDNYITVDPDASLPYKHRVYVTILKALKLLIDDCYNNRVPFPFAPRNGRVQITPKHFDTLLETSLKETFDVHQNLNVFSCSRLFSSVHDGVSILMRIISPNFPLSNCIQSLFNQ